MGSGLAAGGPDEAGMSLRVSVMPSVFQTFIWGRAGKAGTSPIPQKQPLQIGKSGLPPSNSTQTLAPTGGTVKKPTPAPP